jgi:hypothetical protein
MKTRERLKQIKETKSWGRRLFLANDRIPGTKHDEEIMDILVWLMSPDNPETRHNLAGLGLQMARAVRDGYLAWFHDWADAIEQWRSHKPQKDIRTEIFNYIMFHPDASLGKPMSDRTFQVEDILTHLKAKNTNLDEKATRRAIYRICSEFGIKIQGKPGRRWPTHK